MEFSYHKNQVWPAFVKAQSDELLSSWLTRIAHSHLLKVHTFCNIVWPKTQIWNRDLDRSSNLNILNTLSLKTFTPIEEVEQTLLSSYNGYLFEKHTNLTNNRWIMPLGIYHRTRLKYGLMACPICLKQDNHNPYFRKKWRLSLYVCCTSCHTYLIEKCPQCLSPINFFRSELGDKHKNPSSAFRITNCHKCGLDLSIVEARKAPRDIVNFQIKNEQILNNGFSEYTSYSHLYYTGLHSLAAIISSRSYKADIIRTKLAQALQMEAPTMLTYSGIGFDFLDIETRTTILLMANWLLEDWPIRFNTFYRSTIHNGYLFKDMQVIPFWLKRQMGYEDT